MPSSLTAPPAARPPPALTPNAATTAARRSRPWAVRRASARCSSAWSSAPNAAPRPPAPTATRRCAVRGARAPCAWCTSARRHCSNARTATARGSTARRSPRSAPIAKHMARWPTCSGRKRLVSRRPRRAGVRYLACPSCTKIMNRENFGHRSGVIIDVCKGHGVWLDRGELHSVLAFVDSGGLERARRLEDQRQAEERRAFEFLRHDPRQP